MNVILMDKEANKSEASLLELNMKGKDQRPMTKDALAIGSHGKGCNVLQESIW
jgi:hypothetical protein